MYKPTGNMTDDFSENRRQNPTLFSATGGVTSDSYREDAITNGMPARLTHLPDTTAYATQPTADSWYGQLHGTQSPCRPTGTSGIFRTGATLV